MATVVESQLLERGRKIVLHTKALTINLDYVYQPISSEVWNLLMEL